MEQRPREKTKRNPKSFMSRKQKLNKMSSKNPEIKGAIRKSFAVGAEIINVNMIIATDQLIEKYPNPSKDPNSPTGIGHNFAYMVASGAALNPTGSGTGDLAFGAAIGDVVRFTAVSEYNQFRQSVVMYDMFYISGDHIFQNDDFDLKTATGVKTPFPTSFSDFNVKFVDQDFYWGENNISSAGTENYGLRFALYQLERGKQDPTLLGYYQWDPQITVKG